MRAVFFDLIGVLADPQAIHAGMPAAIGAVMAREYGGSPASWSAAFEQVRVDWDSYYADLDLAGDDGVADMWEGIYRTTRALFRIAARTEPSKDELTAFSRRLHGEAFRHLNVFYPDAAPMLFALPEDTLVAAVSPLPTSSINGMLAGAGVVGRVKAIGLDQIEHFRHDRTYWQTAALRFRVNPVECRVVSIDSETVSGAEAAGMRAYLFRRTPAANLARLFSLEL